VTEPRESGFVEQYATLASVQSLMRPYSGCNCSIKQHVALYLSASAKAVPTLYELEQSHAFDSGSSAAIRFMDARLATGAEMLRNLIVDAWVASEGSSVGYPGVSVRDLESGKVAPYPSTVGRR
jgi:hypothetical protein